MTTPRTQQAFTLLEAMIALAILSIGIVGLYGVQTRIIIQNATASRMTTAVAWAAEQMEYLLALNYENLQDRHQDDLNGLNKNNHDPLTADGSEVSPDGVYTILWNVVKDEPINGTKL